MIEIAVVSLLGKLGNLLIEEGNLLHGVKYQVEQLQMELRRLHWFLKDASARQSEDERIRLWVSEVRDFASEAEDVLETYSFEVESRRRGGIARVLKRYACILNEAYVVHQFGAKIKTLTSKISNLTRNFEEFGIRAIMEGESSSSSIQHLLRRSYSHVLDEDFIGLQSDVELLVNNLVNTDYAVFSIYGMGGIGKTTLARKVYKHWKVQRHFDGYSWVCISQQWQPTDILQRILSKLIPGQKEILVNWKEDELVRGLFNILQDKRCLVVLDDIWTMNVWECIKHAFPISQKGSKILVTSRKRDLGLHMGPDGFHHEPRLLSDRESWKLLEKKAFKGKHGQNLSDTHKMKELGKEMVKYCAGLPLAVVVLGGILARKNSLIQWNNVYEDVKSYLWKGDQSLGQEGELLKILALSYNDLPLQLKKCFLYIGKFPEDYNIKLYRLYQMWMAEDMILTEDRKGNESLMDVAERYLGELAERCMVQVKQEEVPTVARFKSCQLHDLMRQLCLQKAKEENFFMYIEHWRENETETAYSCSSLTRRIQRLVIFTDQRNVSNYVPLEKKTAYHLRSLMLLSLVPHLSISRKTESQFKIFRMLRVLAIEGLYLGRKLPKAIGKLIHLRYLGLRKCRFDLLPLSLGKLEHLETLDLKDSSIKKIENMVWKMRGLRHLYLPSCVAYEVPPEKIRLDGLSKLEILENCHTRTCNTTEILKLGNLRVLNAAFHEILLEDYEKIIDHISNSNTIHFTSIIIYKINFLTFANRSIILGKLFSGTSIHELYIRCPMGNLPSPLSSTLTKLVFWESAIEDDPMEALGKLPNLRTLSFRYSAFLGKEMICHEMGFKQLRVLELQGLQNLEKWRMDEGAMPRLSRLRITQCEKLEMLPDGLRFISTLQKLEIKGMPQQFKNRVRLVDGRKGEDFHKVCQVASIVF